VPFSLASVPFTPPPTGAAAFNVFRQRATTILGNAASRLSTSIASWPPGGTCSALTSLGFDAGIAPPGRTGLIVSTNPVTVENIVVTALGGFATESTGLRIFVEEFTGGGAFVRALPGPISFASNVTAIGFGGEIRIDERRTRSASTSVAIVPGRFYRVWVDMLQSVGCGGIWAQAGTNFIYDFTPVFFDFV
jgi:hypothetical protein